MAPVDDQSDTRVCEPGWDNRDAAASSPGMPNHGPQSTIAQVPPTAVPHARNTPGPLNNPVISTNQTVDPIAVTVHTTVQMRGRVT